MIWCVEDDASIRDIEVYALQSTGFEAKGFEDGTSFWEALRTVDMHIRTLRQKLGAYGEKIETVRGGGYRMEGKV